MIAACPTCTTRYRVENERLKSEGLRLRCTRCQTVFRVRPPAPAAPAEARVYAPDPTPAPPAPSAPSAAPPVEPTASAQHEAVSFGSVSPPPVAPVPPIAAPAAAPAPDPWVTAELTLPPRPVDRARLVLVADSDVEAGKELAGALALWGLEALLAHDGVEAILAIQRALPAAVVLDAALPKMFGFQVCELMKRNAELCSIKVVLVGAIHDRDRHRRPPQETYGADAYLERPELSRGLRTVLRDFGVPLERARTEPAPPPPLEGERPLVAPTPDSPVAAPPVAPTPPLAAPAEPVAPAPALAATPVAAVAPAVAPAPPVMPDPLADERAKAERLARIIVSDVILYNEEKFARAVVRGNVAEAMDGELEEGRALFRQRIDARVREERDFLADELVRVALQRGAR